jgi:hypothetical protein
MLHLRFTAMGPVKYVNKWLHVYAGKRRNVGMRLRCS